MAQTVEQALKAALFYSDETVYVLAKLPANGILVAAGVIAEIGEPFCALIADKDEVSLVLPQEALEDFADRLRGHQVINKLYRLITLDVVLEPDLTGFIGFVGSALGKAGISILPYAAHSRDHLFVPADQFEFALQTLKSLQASL